MPPTLRSRSQGRPAPMWSLSDSGAYCVRTMTLVRPELTQLESVKSMMRYLPPKGTAGLARTPDRSERRSPSPPARTTANVRLTRRCYTDAEALRGAARHGVPDVSMVPGGSDPRVVPGHTGHPEHRSHVPSRVRPRLRRACRAVRWSPLLALLLLVSVDGVLPPRRRKPATAARRGRHPRPTAPRRAFHATGGPADRPPGAAPRRTRQAPRAGDPPPGAQHRPARRRPGTARRASGSGSPSPAPTATASCASTPARPGGSTRTDPACAATFVSCTSAPAGRRPGPIAWNAGSTDLRRARQARVHGTGAARVDARRQAREHAESVLGSQIGAHARARQGAGRSAGVPTIPCAASCAPRAVASPRATAATTPDTAAAAGPAARTSTMASTSPRPLAPASGPRPMATWPTSAGTRGTRVDAPTSSSSATRGTSRRSTRTSSRSPWSGQDSTCAGGSASASSGLTGHTSGPHVHWEVSRDFRTMDPRSVRR